MNALSPMPATMCAFALPAMLGDGPTGAPEGPVFEALLGRQLQVISAPAPAELSPVAAPPTAEMTGPIAARLTRSTTVKPVSSLPVAEVASADPQLPPGSSPAAPVKRAVVLDKTTALLVATMTNPAGATTGIALTKSVEVGSTVDRPTLLAADGQQATAISARVSDVAPVFLGQANNALESVVNIAPLAVERHLDLARGDVWLDDLARDIAASAAGGGHLKFALAPESLGRLDVEVRHGETGVSVHLAARNEHVRDVLATAQPRLIDEIRAQGVRVASTEIAADTSGFRGDRDGQMPRQSRALLIEASAPLRTAGPEPRKPMAVGRYA